MDAECIYAGSPNVYTLHAIVCRTSPQAPLVPSVCHAHADMADMFIDLQGEHLQGEIRTLYVNTHTFVH